MVRNRGEVKEGENKNGKRSAIFHQHFNFEFDFVISVTLVYLLLTLMILQKPHFPPL